MKVLEVTEQADGSAIVRFDLSAEEVGLLLEKAIIDVLKETIEQSKTNLDNTGWGSLDCQDGPCKQSCQSGQCNNSPKTN
ncbi:hypothetical protein UFOVP249_54 [uncultured Caudovirales phage]|uniref:Uncharacterized protein n=1 Tax=uncultured Caudovirales phage TaxID=2100421 RepID=A0A6J5LH42_9CAUD|nr:hypothetical protein UFOVP249_54 [uncultured Caudovirales phage]